MRFLSTILIVLTFTFTALSQDCSQPKERGFKCHDANSKQRFFYEPERGTCLPFYFLGCGGNENSFGSFEECNQVCVLKTKTPKKPAEKMKAKQNLTVKVCDLITDAKISELAQSCGDGMDTPCKMGYVCKEEWCCPSKHTICHLPASSGNEAQAHKHYGRYVYLPGLNNCIRFSYFGKVKVCDLITDAKISELAQSCGDGMDTPCKMGYVCKEEWCCPSKHTICHLPASSGNEAQAHKHYGRYVYLPGLNNCIRFSYFGKEGNFNNFKTYNECKEYCLPSKGEKKEGKKKESD